MREQSKRTFQYYEIPSVCAPGSAVRHAAEEGGTYRVVEMILLRALLLVSLHDTELGRVLGVLHDVPVECLSPGDQHWSAPPPICRSQIGETLTSLSLRYTPAASINLALSFSASSC